MFGLARKRMLRCFTNREDAFRYASEVNGVVGVSERVSGANRYCVYVTGL